MKNPVIEAQELQIEKLKNEVARLKIQLAQAMEADFTTRDVKLGTGHLTYYATSTEIHNAMDGFIKLWERRHDVHLANLIAIRKRP